MNGAQSDPVLDGIDRLELPGEPVDDVHAATVTLDHEVQMIRQCEVDVRVEIESGRRSLRHDGAAQLDELTGNGGEQLDEVPLVDVVERDEDTVGAALAHEVAAVGAESDALTEEDALHAALVLDEHDARVEHLLDDLHAGLY